VICTPAHTKAWGYVQTAAGAAIGVRFRVEALTVLCISLKWPRSPPLRPSMIHAARAIVPR
jgi:hypothetical protein